MSGRCLKPWHPGGAVRGGARSSAISALTRWQLEPDQRPLSRLAEHAGSLAVRQEKAAVQADIDDWERVRRRSRRRLIWRGQY